MRLESGTQLGPYEITGLIGAGGMGEVYRAKDKRLGRDVAIKVLPAHFSKDSERLRRFELEARATGILNQPNILTIYDIGTYDDSPYVVSELLEGKTLRQLQSGTPLTPRRVLDYSIQIANGLAAAHEKHIVHRDLKPENLFITKEGHVKILDFGLAKLTQEPNENEGITSLSTATGAGVLMGTVGYTSPEQLKGETIDQRSDIFAFGAILYEMLSGKVAFKRDSTIETLNAILKEEPPEFSGTNLNIPPALERIMRACLEKDPGHRFQSSRDLALALQAVSGSNATGGITATIPVRRKSLSTAFYLLLFLLPIVAVGTFLLGQRLSKRQPVAAPIFQKLTFRRGNVTTARFTPDGNTIVYSAAWEAKPPELFSTFPGSMESRSLGITGANIHAITPENEMAITLPGSTLATVPFGGGSPRELQKDVFTADIAPDGKTYAILRNIPGKFQIEYPPGKVLYKAGDSGWPWQLRISPDGTLVAFINIDDKKNEVSVNIVDTKGNRKLLSRWLSVRGLAWAPGGKEIVFRGSKVDGDCICAVTLNGTTRHLLDIAPGNIRFVLDVDKAGRILVSEGNRRNSVIGLAPGEAKERDLSWFDFSDATDLSADGTTVLFDEENLADRAQKLMYLRKTDGAPAVRLGEGLPSTLSPDGRMLIGFPSTSDTLHLILTPTGAGTQRRLPNNAQFEYARPYWLPDGKRILFAAVQGGHPSRIFLQTLQDGKVQPITGEGVETIDESKPVSPDGKWVFARKADQFWMYPISGGEPKLIQGLQPNDTPIGWTSDGTSLYVRADGLTTTPARIFLLNLSTGHREFWKELAPPDTAGVSYVDPVFIAANGKSYVYSYWRELTDVYLVKGLL